MSYAAIYSPHDEEDVDGITLQLANKGQPIEDEDHESLFNSADKTPIPKPTSQVQVSVRRRRIATVFVAFGIMGLVAVVVVLAVLYHKGHQSSLMTSTRAADGTRRFSFSDISNPLLFPVLPNLKWMPKTSWLVKFSPYSGELQASSPTGEGDNVLAKLKTGHLDFHSISPNEKYALMNKAGDKQLFRYGTIGVYAVVKLAGVNSDSPAEGKPFVLFNGKDLRLVQWTATGGLLFVPAAEPDIYYQSNAEGGVPVKLTTNGRNQFILNGYSDWLFEEEILASDSSMWPAPNGHTVAYITFNETNVDYFSWVQYGDPSRSYVNIRKLRYPKAGHTNPTFQITVQSLSPITTLSSTLIPPAALKNATGYYVTNIVWLNSTHLSAMWMPRLQTVAYLTVYDITKMMIASQLAPVSTLQWTAPVGWVEIYKFQPVFGGSALLMRLPRLEAPHFVHLALVRLVRGSHPLRPVFLTSGQWEVTDISSVNHANTYALVQATVAGPFYRHLYRVPLTSRDLTYPFCLSCHGGSSCKYNTFKISTAADNFLWSCEGPGMPRSHIARVRSTGPSKIVSIITTNSELKRILKQVSIPNVDYLRLPVNGNMLPALRMTPSDGLRASGRVPTLMYGYNGPLVQAVNAQSTLMMNGELGRWLMYLVENHGFQVFIVDGRGTPYLGDTFGKAQFMKPGEVESDDQIGAARYIIRHYRADPDRLAFWGWSYGGFLSSYIATRSDNVFPVCIATAPVTDWRYYDTAYTERMMGLPSQNPHYNKSSIIKRAGNFGRTKYLVIAGSSDDNVHFQNTAQLAAALTEHEVQFRMQVYTDKAHDLAGEHTKHHLFKLLTDFLITSFDMKQ